MVIDFANMHDLNQEIHLSKSCFKWKIIKKPEKNFVMLEKHQDLPYAVFQWANDHQIITKSEKRIISDVRKVCFAKEQFIKINDTNVDVDAMKKGDALIFQAISKGCNNSWRTDTVVGCHNVITFNI